MHLPLLLDQSWPVLTLQLALLQHHLHIARRVIDLTRLGIDLLVEVQHDVVGRFLRLRVAREGQRGGLDVEFEFGGGDVGHGDGEEEVVFLGVGGGGALGPGYWVGGLVLRVWEWVEVCW